MDKRDLPVLRVFQGSGAVGPVEVFVLPGKWEWGPCSVPSPRVGFHTLNLFGNG